MYNSKVIQLSEQAVITTAIYPQGVSDIILNDIVEEIGRLAAEELLRLKDEGKKTDVVVGLNFMPRETKLIDHVHAELTKNADIRVRFFSFYSAKYENHTIYHLVVSFY